MLASLPFSANAGTATAFAMKRGRAVAHAGGIVPVALLPGVDIPAGALVEVTSGILGVKLPDGTNAYFGGGTSFRLSLPDVREETPEIILLSGGVVLATTQGDFIVRCAAGTATVGDCTAAIVFAPRQDNVPGAMLVRVASGSVGANPADGRTVLVEKNTEAIFPMTATPIIRPLQKVPGETIVAASQGNLPALRASLQIPAYATPVATDTAKKPAPAPAESETK